MHHKEAENSMHMHLLKPTSVHLLANLPTKEKYVYTCNTCKVGTENSKHALAIIVIVNTPLG